MSDRSFHSLAVAAERISAARGARAKTRICAGYLHALEEDEDLELAVQFLAEGAFSALSGKRASVGSRTYSMGAAQFCEIDYEKVFKPCKTALGSASEAIEKLMANIDAAREKRIPDRPDLQEVLAMYEKLYGVSSRAGKQEILKRAWQRMEPVEIKYFIRIMSRGSLRIGFETRSMVNAVARAWDRDPGDVRYAHMITGSAGRTAVLARKGELDQARFTLFQPLSFMLASPVESRAVENFSDYLVEEKIDGMRSQVHVSGQQVQLFSRDLNDITHSFPEVVQFYASRALPDLVLDGELCVYRNEEILPFPLLQKRMGRKKPGREVLDKYPVLFIAFDVLYHDGGPVFERSLTERRELLEELAAAYRLPVTSQFEAEDRGDVDRLSERALAHGNEGLMLKRRQSTYEYGQRGTSWLKVKKPGGTLDVILMYAHAGSGKRGGTYSDFTLGVSVKEDEHYEEEFIPIGKAGSGCTDEEMEELNRKIREITVERYGPTLGLLPEIVIELEFDGIQVNKRTKANYTLRLPRFKAIRWDLGPGDVDTLREVERMYREKLDRDRLKQHENPSFYYGE